VQYRTERSVRWIHRREREADGGPPREPGDPSRRRQV